MTKLNNMQAEILKGLKMYERNVAEKIEEAKKVSTNQAKKDIQKKAPVKTGSYKRGWKVKKSRNKYIAYNKTDYQLTHLLEKPHAKRGGGRSIPQVHIKPAEEKAIELFEELVKQAVKE